MRVRQFILLVVTAVVVSFLHPAAAQASSAPGASSAADGTATRLASCDNPPDDPAATTENRDRYVGLWSARIADKAWMKHFASLPTVPDDVKAEGFHSLNGQVQLWLNACLLDDMLATAHETPAAAKYNQYLTGLNMVIFGKDGLAKMREQLNQNLKPDPAKTLPVKKDQTAESLKNMVGELSGEPSLTSADQPRVSAEAPATSTTKNSASSATQGLQTLVQAPALVPATSTPKAVTPSLVPSGLDPNPITKLPLVPQLLAAVNAVLQLISKIQNVLFTLPVVNLLASAFYKICAESPTMPLACSISLPVGVPIPVDVSGDNVPDILGDLGPFTNLKDIGAKFRIQRLAPNAGPLPAHVFAVYDTPIVKKRIEFGFDGRASTLANTQAVKATVENIIKAVTGDIQVTADVTSKDPGSTEALTFAVKDLVGGSAGVQPSEENPLGGAVQMSPFPTDVQVGAHLIHTTPRSEDIFTVASSTPTKVNAVIDQKTTTTAVKSSRRFTAEVDKLPTSVKVDLVRNGEHQSIAYDASAPIDAVSASDTTTPDVSHPGSYTASQYAVKGVPTSIDVDLQGAQDITYQANATIPEASFSTQTLKDGVLQQQIDAAAHQIPKSIHVTNLTSDAQQKIGYTADSKLGDVVLGMYDLDENGHETNLSAKATGIPTQMDFTSTAATGAYDFTSNTGIDLIEATLTRDGGSVLPMPGTDHATVDKRGDQLGLDFRLSGFRSAHFDGHEKTNVALGLSPGGQTFDAIADIDDPAPGPNVYATAHVGALPADMAVSFDPANGTADYQASSVIPLLRATFTDRDTQMFGDAKLTDLPKTIGLTFNTSGSTPEATYSADSRLGSIELTYSEKPGGLAVHGLISDLPTYLKIGGLDPIVFDARTSAVDLPGSSYLGQVLFQYATDGVFASPPTTDDHAYVDTDLADSTHAELQYSGLRYLSVDTSGQQLHATIKNTAARLFRAYLTTPTLTLTGFIDKVPAEITVAQVGNLVTYDASSTIHEISTSLHRSNGDDLAVQVKDVPANVAVLFDGAQSKLVWDSSAPTGLLSAIAHLTPATLGGTRAFDAGLTITDIPVHWNAGWANGNVDFATAAPGIGSIDAKVTNHGAYHTLPGDHLNAFYDQPAGDLDASLHVSNLQKIGFTKLTGGNGGGFDAALNMGDHGQLNFGAQIDLGANRLTASGSFTHLPSQIHLRSDGGRITYDGNDNPTLTLSVAAGDSTALGSTPVPPTVHGVAVRDGQSGTGKAVRANLYVTGLPDHLDLNSPAGTYEVDGFHPTDDTLVVDAKLNALSPAPLTLQVQQKVPTASPVNFTFGPFLSSTGGDGTHHLSLAYNANQTLGKLTAEATYNNTDDARLEISQIPSSINVNAGFGADTKTVGIAMSHGIDDITASYKKADMADFAASVHLGDVPSAVNITIGKSSDSDGAGTDVDAPVFTMDTSAPGMDIDAFAKAEITDPVNANAAVALAVTNLGSHVTGALDGSRLHITSSPATESFSLQAAGRVQKSISLNWDGGIFQNTGSLGADLKINKVTVGLTDFSDVNLRLGFTTGLDGNFSSFTFGQESNLTIDIVDDFSVFIDWPDPFGSDTINLVTIPHQVIPLGNVVPNWHINANVPGEIFHIPFFFFVIGECSVVFDARPAPGFTTATSTFTLPAPPSDGSHTPAWLLTPDIHLLGLSIPDFGLDIIAYFLSPYDHEITAHPDCYTYF